jgi:hypothetical protein
MVSRGPNKAVGTTRNQIQPIFRKTATRKALPKIEIRPRKISRFKKITGQTLGRRYACRGNHVADG